MKFIYIPKFKFGKIKIIFEKKSIFSKMSVTVFCQKWAEIVRVFAKIDHFRDRLNFGQFN